MVDIFRIDLIFTYEFVNSIERCDDLTAAEINIDPEPVAEWDEGRVDERRVRRERGLEQTVRDLEIQDYSWIPSISFCLILEARGLWGER